MDLTMAIANTESASKYSNLVEVITIWQKNWVLFKNSGCTFDGL